ncbi:MAG: hypothetical protein NVSMB52_16690 [Chloroflexota bacterium]
MTDFSHTPHPRVEARRRARPVKRSDHHIGFNGRIAAWMTQRIGTMWSVYIVTIIVGAWMILAQAGPLSFDKYPFSFMLFLGNVVQLLLIFVILVGQQVLGATAERRATETYEDAEALLHEVEQLHTHLVAQDRILTKGLGLCGVPVHPSTEGNDVVVGAVRIEEKEVTLNGKIAAFVTKGVGTMWAFYIAAIFQFGWIALAQAGIIHFDPYPFPFLLFLSSLVQLILMFIIMVGQEVLGATGDQRAAQTYEDAEAVLKECSRLQEHLSRQDEILIGIVDALETNTVSA